MIDLLALVLTMATLGIFAWVIRGLHKIEKETMARVRECDFPFENQDKGKAK